MFSGFLIGFIISIIFLIVIFICCNTVQLTTDQSEECTRHLYVTTKWNWRVWKDCWKFQILPFIRLKYKNYIDCRKFNITLGWLFAYFKIEFEWR